ncbi:MAG: hypothetical protein B7Z40_17980 [Bosea sp. 12-68-7]|nr:MAG: hypothetical protein B7Z40_17980 [Bosea sp. 12-68-7]
MIVLFLLQIQVILIDLVLLIVFTIDPLPWCRDLFRGPRCCPLPAAPILFLGFVDTEPLPQSAWVQDLGRLAPRQATALVEHGGRPGDLAGWAVHVHAGVVEAKVLERAQAAAEPDQGLGFKGVAALARAFGQNGLSAGKALVKAGKRDRRDLGGRSAVCHQGLAIAAR